MPIMGQVKAVYKVRDPKTGLFQVEGVYPRWTKNGKAWSTLGHLRSHFTSMREYKNSIDPDWEILEFKVETTPGQIIRLGDFLAKGKK